MHDKLAYFILKHLSIRQLQAISGTTAEAYSKWAKEKKTEELVDDLGNSARLMWAGARETEHVVIYCHGGGFVGPLSAFQKAILKNHGVKLGVAVLQYSLYPASYPTQLNQLQLAVHHIMSLGVAPAHIFLAGDSAGGNLVLQFLSHILHPSPLAAAAPSTSMTGFRGVCLISPWVMLDGATNSETANESLDLVPATCLRHWQDTYLKAVPDAHRTYVQVADVQLGWFSGIHNVANRILITAGRNEVLQDSIQRLAEVIQGEQGDVQLVMQTGGVHCDPIFDVAAKSTAPHAVQNKIIDWLAECIYEKGSSEVGY
ncbi:Alpha/Beta hydrolase protein [Mycena capillaripes]|nr:Alpha/Beta hydrolase protein [Mycena capillaripes]